MAQHIAVLRPISAALAQRPVSRCGVIGKESPMVAQIRSATGAGFEGETWRLLVRLQRKIEQCRWVSVERRSSDGPFGDYVNA